MVVNGRNRTMMDSSERPHRTGSTGSTSELFICFTSRLSSSSSSMKISSKSILSPGRARDAPVSLSTSLSRRLRTNGSLKGGQSPMFPTGAKKRGCAFENPEPSSPKVTCIGQVRVKTKKQGKKMRTLSKRRGSGEVSFRRVEQTREGVNQSHSQNYQANANNQYQPQQQECLPHRTQRWVHLPLTICEALRAFGAEFSCLFPCRSSSCFSTSEREKEEKANGSSEGTGQSSCGAVFARWLVALQDGEGGKGREIELVVGGGEEESTETRERTFIRHAVEEMEIKDEICEVKDGAVEEEEARVSICIPPKNALLLMRCRSDPMRMSALANRFWESPAPKGEEEEEKEEEEEDDHHEEEDEEGKEAHEDVEEGDSRLMEDKELVEMYEKLVSTEAIEEEEEENPEAEAIVVMEVEEAEGKENPEEEKLEINDGLRKEEEDDQEPEVEVANQTVAEEENENVCSSEAFVDPENFENENALLIQEREEEEEEEEEDDEEEEMISSHRCSSVVSVVHSDFPDDELEAEALAEEATLEEEEDDEAEEKSTEEKETQETALKEEEEEIVTRERSESEQTQKEEGIESEEREPKEERESEVKKKEERENSSLLPDCLLLMRCEPKLSMEVSKETWVCSADFIRWLPERQVKTKDGGDEPKKRICTDSNPALLPQPAHHQPPLQQPPRSSCSLPAAGDGAGVSMATMIEQKLVNAVAYEPFVLTRCKSEPMRTAAAKLVPETCFWKDRKLEPHRRATIGVGAAGVGF